MNTGLLTIFENPEATTYVLKLRPSTPMPDQAKAANVYTYQRVNSIQ